MIRPSWSKNCASTRPDSPVNPTREQLSHDNNGTSFGSFASSSDIPATVTGTHTEIIAFGKTDT